MADQPTQPKDGKKHPPKPDGIEPNPRAKKKNNNARGRQSILDDLSAISGIYPSYDYHEQINDEVRAQKNDRGAAILIATNVENVLEEAIKRQLHGVRNYKDLFGFNSPFGSFSFKTRVGFAMGIFGIETYDNLDVIRSIRNVFAHAKISINFEDERVIAACSLLKIQDLIAPVSRPADWKPETQQEKDAITGRRRFDRVCTDIMHNLFMRTLHGPTFIEADSITVGDKKLDTKGLVICVIPKPLP